MTYKILGIILLSYTLSYSQGESELNKKAVEIYNNINKAIVSGENERIFIGDEAAGEANLGNYVTYGGEKEGSSSLITRVLGPNESTFTSYVSHLDEGSREKFLKDFLGNWFKGKYRNKNVVDKEGKKIALEGKVYVDQIDESNKITHSFESLKKTKWSNLSLTELESKFKIWLKIVGDKPFSFVSKQARSNIYNGKKLSGLNSQNSLKNHKSFTRFTPLHGLPEKYLYEDGKSVVTTSVGWEIKFKPQKSYGEFEEMISWFRKSLKNVGKEFEAPGHQWIVIPKNKSYIDSDSGYFQSYTDHGKKTLKKIKEVYRNIQSYIVLQGIAGRAGIEFSSYKRVHTDRTWAGNGHDTSRGVIRIQDNRFKVDDANSFNIEQRAGTKSDILRRKIQKMMISRVASGYLSDLSDADSWNLETNVSFDEDKFAKKYNISKLEFIKFKEAFNENAMIYRRGKSKKMDRNYLVPFWNWDQAPFLSENKKKYLNELTGSFVKSIASAKNPNGTDIAEIMRQWVVASKLSEDIENYLTPRLKIDLKKAVNFNHRAGSINVNRLDFGIEYSGRFPMKLVGEYVDIPGRPGKKEWVKTYFDYTQDEKRELLKKYAETLNKNLTGNSKAVVKEIKADGHGHGLDIAFELKDAKDRTWRVEWDGIGRSYDPNGNMLAESVRGGHLEVVTPKFTPTATEVRAVFDAFKKNSVLPYEKMGGGHVNFDLKPFEGKPKAMASFIANYLDLRKQMTVLFQFPGRFLGGEPNVVSQKFIDELHNFSGTEEELKQLLYNEKFFNTRVGRKTKNTQLNIIAYFQDVIPEEFIHEDFDMKNDYWRKTFDTQPKIRKGEFRMFNAPRNETESALQIKFVKALYNQALNETSFPNIDTKVNFDWDKVGTNFKSIEKSFETKLKRLGLDPQEYKGMFYEGLENFKRFREMDTTVSISRKVGPHPKASGWGKAVKARSIAIASEGRKWKGKPIPEAVAFKDYLNKGSDYVASLGSRKEFLTRDHGKLGLEFSMSKSEIESLKDVTLRTYTMYLNRKKFKGFDKEMEKLASEKSSEFIDAFKYAYDNGKHTDGIIKWFGESFKFLNHPIENQFFTSKLTNILSVSYDEKQRTQILDLFVDGINKGNYQYLDDLLMAANRAESNVLAQKILRKISPGMLVKAQAEGKLKIELLQNLSDSAKLNTQIFTMIKDLEIDEQKKFYMNAMTSENDRLFEFAYKWLNKNAKDYLYKLAIGIPKANFNNFRNSIFVEVLRNEIGSFDKMEKSALVKRLEDLPKEHLYKTIFNFKEFGFTNSDVLDIFDEVLDGKDFENMTGILEEHFKLEGYDSTTAHSSNYFQKEIYTEVSARSKGEREFVGKIFDRIESLDSPDAQEYVNTRKYKMKKALLGDIQSYDEYLNLWKNNFQDKKSHIELVNEFLEVSTYSYTNGNKLEREKILNEVLDMVDSFVPSIETDIKNGYKNTKSQLENFVVLASNSNDTKLNLKVVKYLTGKNKPAQFDIAFRQNIERRMITVGELDYDFVRFNKTKIDWEKVGALGAYSKSKSKEGAIVIDDIVNLKKRKSLSRKSTKILSKASKEKLEVIKKMSLVEISELKPRDSLMTLYYQNKHAQEPITLKRLLGKSLKYEESLNQILASFEDDFKSTEFFEKSDFLSWFVKSWKEIDHSKFSDKVRSDFNIGLLEKKLLSNSKLNSKVEKEVYSYIFHSSENLSYFLNNVDVTMNISGGFMGNFDKLEISNTKIQKLKVSPTGNPNDRNRLKKNLKQFIPKYLDSETKDSARYLALINTFPEELVYEYLNDVTHKVDKQSAKKIVALMKHWKSNFKAGLLKSYIDANMSPVAKFFREEVRRTNNEVVVNRGRNKQLPMEEALFHIYKKYPDSSKAFEISVLIKENKSNVALSETYLATTFSKNANSKYLKWLTEIFTQRSIVASLGINNQKLSRMVENLLKNPNQAKMSQQLFLNLIDSTSFLFRPESSLVNIIPVHITNDNKNLSKYLQYLERTKSSMPLEDYVNLLSATMTLDAKNCCSNEVLEKRNTLIKQLSSEKQAVLADSFIARMARGHSVFTPENQKYSLSSFFDLIMESGSESGLKEFAENNLSRLDTRNQNTVEMMNQYISEKSSQLGSVRAKGCEIHFEAR